MNNPLIDHLIIQGIFLFAGIGMITCIVIPLFGIALIFRKFMQSYNQVNEDKDSDSDTESDSDNDSKPSPIIPEKVREPPTNLVEQPIHYKVNWIIQDSSPPISLPPPSIAPPKRAPSPIHKRHPITGQVAK